MNSFGILAGILQLGVPSYGLRLVRAFGAQRVGWFIVLAFSSLALLHLAQSFKPMGTGMDMVYVFASGMLLVGMGHLETLFSERNSAEKSRARQRTETAEQINEQMAELTRANQALVLETARRAEQIKALTESETQYRSLFEDNPLPMWIVDLRSSRFLAVNEAALRLYGFSHAEFMALGATDLVPASAATAALRDLAQPCSGRLARGIWQHRRKDGTTLDLETAGLDLSFGNHPGRLIVAQDLSAHRQHELKVCAAQKMEALAQVAGGVAHHFNNILTVIGGLSEMLQQTRQKSEAVDQLEQISAAVKRGANLTQGLLAAAGRHPLERQALDLNAMVEDLKPHLSGLLGERISFRCNYRVKVAPISADPGLLEGIIVNLVLNAREAMPAGGSLELSTSLVRVEPPSSEGQASEQGEFVRLTLRDTGLGMTPELQARMFEPFFTTKDVGRGAGLGLASSYGLIKQHGGWIEASSQPGAGTEFRIFFPTAKLEAAANHRKETALPRLTRKETILLVEGDDRARALARHFLTHHGYRVVEASDGETALLLWEGQASHIDLLLIDASLPGEISGPELAIRLAEGKQGLKVAFTGSQSEQADLAAPNRTFIPKPFTQESLLEIVDSSFGQVREKRKV